MDALIVSNSDNAFKSLAELINSSGGYNIVFAKSAVASRRAVSERVFEIVVVALAKTGEGRELAEDIASKCGCGVILVEENNVATQIMSRASEAGVIVVPRPIYRPMFLLAVYSITAANSRIKSLISENDELSKRIEDIKLVDRAKYTMMESLGYNENQAHKYIEKRAMNERKTRREIAMEILKTYGV